MPYTLKEKGRTESLTQGSTSIVRTFLCEPWAGRIQASLDLLGYVRLIGGRLVRVFPKRDPDYRYAFCKSVEIGPIGDPGEEEYFVARGPNPHTSTGDFSGGAWLTATYTNPDFTAADSQAAGQDEKQEIEIASLSWEFSGHALTLPNRYLVWKDAVGGGAGQDDTPVQSEVSPTINVPKFDVILTRHYVLNKPIKSILANLGRINTNDFRIGKDTYPAGTLRFDTAQISQKLTNQGLKFFDVSYRFGVMGKWDTYTKDDGNHEVGWVTWNHVYDPKRGHWRKPVWFSNQDRGIYLKDEDTDAYSINLGGAPRKGFRLLFHPRAN